MTYLDNSTFCADVYKQFHYNNNKNEINEITYSEISQAGLGLGLALG